jgi:transposase
MKVYIGIDWSEKKHDVCFVNEQGEVIQAVEIAHSPEGFVKLNKAREQSGVGAGECLVGVETSHNILIDYLLEQGYGQIYVLPPNAVKSAQGRYRQSGAKSDRSDARLIADMLRVDREKYHAWVPDSQLTRQIRARVSLIGYLNKQIWQSGNRLRAALLRYYPSALEVFSSLDSPISLAWIIAYPTPAAAQGVSYEAFQAFVKGQHHTQPKKWAGCYARLKVERATASAEITEVYAKEAVLLAELMKEMVQNKTRLLNELQKAYGEHPDYAIYHSLPAAGEYLEPALLAKLGDDRGRYPSAETVQALAGTCPVTKQSGKSRVVTFRRACDHEFRQIVQQWAKLSIQKSPWAAGYYEMVRPHCSSENEAYRKLGNRWLEVLWKLWQTRERYDEEKHLRAQARRGQPKA